MLLGELLMREIQIILIDETSVETFSLLVEGAVTIVWQDLVGKGLIHSTLWIWIDTRFGF